MDEKMELHEDVRQKLGFMGIGLSLLGLWSEGSKCALLRRTEKDYNIIINK